MKRNTDPNYWPDHLRSLFIAIGAAMNDDRVTAMRLSFVTPFVVVLAVTTLTSCATTGYQPSSFVLIVEGNEASYPAFEAAAKACAYTAYWRFPGSVATPNVTVGPHYNLSRVGSRAARCTTTWVDQHPETGLTISGE